MTSVDEICAEAAAIAGTDDFGDDWFRVPLAAWLEDLERPHLNDFGRSFLRRLAVRDVVRRLRVLATLREHPEIAEVRVPPIVYISGIARSGTTLLHNLLALHPRARSLLRWELMEPIPPPEAATYRTDPRIALTQASVERLRGSPLERMHWVEAEDPEECAWGFLDAVSMLGQGVMGCMPAWRRALFEADFTVVFEHHRSLIQLLTWRNPVPPDGFLVLKAPQIAGQAARLASALPEARFVITHRDPYRCTVSTAAITEVIAAPFCSENPVTNDGRGERNTLAIAAHGLAGISSFSATAPDRVVHVPYPELLAEPAAVVARIFGAAGIDGGELAPAIDGFLAAQRAGRRQPAAEIGTMGYDRADVESHPVVAAYRERFAVAREETRLTDVAAR